MYEAHGNAEEEGLVPSRKCVGTEGRGTQCVQKHTEKLQRAE